MLNKTDQWRYQEIQKKKEREDTCHRLSNQEHKLIKKWQQYLIENHQMHLKVDELKEIWIACKRRILKLVELGHCNLNFLDICLKWVTFGPANIFLRLQSKPTGRLSQTLKEVEKVYYNQRKTHGAEKRFRNHHMKKWEKL